MTRYVVVTRKSSHPIDRFLTLAAAANYVVRERKFAQWTVLAQEANKITAATPYRALFDNEQRVLETHLYPTLFE